MRLNLTILELFNYWNTGEIALYITQSIFLLMLSTALGIKNIKQGIKFLIKVMASSLFMTIILWMICKPGKFWILIPIGIAFGGLIWLMLTSLFVKGCKDSKSYKDYFKLSTKPNWKTLALLIAYMIWSVHICLCIFLFIRMLIH